MKILSMKIHGYADYALILALLFAPSLLTFVEQAATMCYALAAAYFILVMATAYPFGLFKAVPFAAHGALELILCPFLILLPWLGGFSFDANATRFFLSAGGALFFIWVLTDYKKPRHRDYYSRRKTSPGFPLFEPDSQTARKM